MKLFPTIIFFVVAIVFSIGNHSNSVADENFCGPICRDFIIPSTHGDCLIDEVLIFIEENDTESEELVSFTLKHCDPFQIPAPDTQSPGGEVILLPEYPLQLKRSDLDCLVDHYDIVQWSEQRREGMVRVFDLTRCDIIRERN